MKRVEPQITQITQIAQIAQIQNQPSGTVFLDFGGPMRKIIVNGRIVEFEMHPWAGPNILNARGEPRANQPARFLHAASLWAQQGQRIENGFCVWDHEPKPITQHMGGRHHKLVGWQPAERGA